MSLSLTCNTTSHERYQRFLLERYHVQQTPFLRAVAVWYYILRRFWMCRETETSQLIHFSSLRNTLCSCSWADLWDLDGNFRSALLRPHSKYWVLWGARKMFEACVCNDWYCSLQMLVSKSGCLGQVLFSSSVQKVLDLPRLPEYSFQDCSMPWERNELTAI